MLYLTYSMIFSVDLAYYRVSRAKDWVSVDCGTTPIVTCYVNCRQNMKLTASDVKETC